MLIQFRFNNFKSFRDDTILDLSATKITENSSHVIPIGTEKISVSYTHLDVYKRQLQGWLLLPGEAGRRLG